MFSLFKVIMVISMIFLASLSSCNNLPFLATPTPTPLSKWITNWLNNPSCQAPCWEHIIPGETNILDSPMILAQVPDVKKIDSFPSNNQTRDYSQVMWNFLNPGESGTATTEKEELTISTIRLKVSVDQNLFVKQVASSYGLPSEVFLYDCRGEITNLSCVVHLIYDDRGMVLELLLPNIGKGNNQIRLAENSRIFAIWFFPLGENSYGESIGKNSGNFPTGLIPWKGFVEYP